VIRAFTPNDVKALKETVKSFPKSVFYDMEQQFTQLGIGQAFVTVLNEKGIPTETVVTHLAPPASFMGPLDSKEYQDHLEHSEFYKKYKEAVDPRSAFEILSEKLTAVREEQEQANEQKAAAPRPVGRPRHEKSTMEEVLSSPITKQVGKELVRGVFGMLFGSTPKRRSSRSLF
jgi:hypothetical protein